MFYNYYSTKKYRDLMERKGYIPKDNLYCLMGAFKHHFFQDNRLLLAIIKNIFPCLYIQKDLSNIDINCQSLSSRYFRIFGNSYFPAAIPGYDKNISYTFLIDLKPAIEEIFKKFDYSLQKQIKKSQKLGFTVERINSLSDFQIYYKLLKTFRQNKGFSTESEYYATQMWEIMHSPDNDSCYEVFLCKNANGNIMSGMGLIINHEEKISIEVASARSLEAESNKMPDNDFLKYNILVWAKSRGIESFDLAGADPDAPPNSKEHNIYKYKEKWGGTIAKIYHYQKTSNNKILYMLANSCLSFLSRFKK